MQKQIDFKNNESYYSLYEDYDVINADFRKFYNRSLKDVILDKEIKWPEFSYMIANLGEKSGLAYLVYIRSEKDPVKIKKFTPAQRKIYLDWKKNHKTVIKVNANDIKIMQDNHNAFINALKSTGKFIDKTK